MKTILLSLFASVAIASAGTIGAGGAINTTGGSSGSSGSATNLFTTNGWSISSTPSYGGVWIDALDSTGKYSQKYSGIYTNITPITNLALQYASGNGAIVMKQMGSTNYFGVGTFGIWAMFWNTNDTAGSRLDHTLAPGIGADPTTNFWSNGGYANNANGVGFPVTISKVYWATNVTGVGGISFQKLTSQDNDASGRWRGSFYGNGQFLSSVPQSELVPDILLTNTVITVNFIGDSFTAGTGAAVSWTNVLLTSMSTALSKMTNKSFSYNNGNIVAGTTMYEISTNISRSGTEMQRPSWLWLARGINDLRFGITNYVFGDPAANLIWSYNYFITNALAITNFNGTTHNPVMGIVMWTVPQWCPISQYTNVSNNGFTYAQFLKACKTVRKWQLSQVTNGVIVLDYDSLPITTSDGLHPDTGSQNMMGWYAWNSVVYGFGQQQRAFNFGDLLLVTTNLPTIGGNQALRSDGTNLFFQ